MIEGERLRLLTDLPPSAEVDRLPEIFAAAVPHWAEYFDVSLSRLRDWKMQGCLIADRQRFHALGLLPKDNADFTNGYAYGRELWMMEQPSDYYRRHLLLHEGTHGFMLTQLGSCGPGWFMEGTAELLGTHDWNGRELRLGVVPAHRRAAPMWGRVKLVRDARQRGAGLSLGDVLEIDNRRSLDATHYAWTWTLAALLERDPRFHDRFRKLQQHVADSDFNRVMRTLFARDWQVLNRQWVVTAATLDYGHDFEKMSIVERETAPIAETRSVEVAAGRGWQSTGWRLAAGQTYRVTAQGRYQIAVDDDSAGRAPWPCEPGGVTLDYHEGRPLGALLGAMEPIEPAAATGRESRARPASLENPMLIGLAADVRSEVDAVLYLRVNDASSRLGDNQGRLQATIHVD